MKTFQEKCAELAELETFDPEAFVGTVSVPQQVCSFVLALALVHNDFKDLIDAHLLMDAVRPQGRPQKTRLWGTSGGIENHLLRLLIALLHELLELIESREAVLKTALFKSIIEELPTPTRQNWETVVEVAQRKNPSNQMGKDLRLIRNTVAFHYDPKSVFKGYKKHFGGPDREDAEAFISRGRNLTESRFYFADAAAKGQIEDVMGSANLVDLNLAVNHALMGIVLAFIETRGVTYKKASEP